MRPSAKYSPLYGKSASLKNCQPLNFLSLSKPKRSLFGSLALQKLRSTSFKGQVGEDATWGLDSGFAPNLLLTSSFVTAPGPLQRIFSISLSFHSCFSPLPGGSDSSNSARCVELPNVYCL